ncbi:MAG: 50S ribosomal protein L14 [Patescibacteria group bacterium]
MIQRYSLLNVADNSGAKKLKVVGIPEASNKLEAGLGELITCVVRGAIPTGIVKDHEIVRAVVVRLRKESRRRDGSYIRFDENAAVVVDKDGNPRGSRIFGPVARELRDKDYPKIVSLAPEVW